MPPREIVDNPNPAREPQDGGSDTALTRLLQDAYQGRERPGSSQDRKKAEDEKPETPVVKAGIERKNGQVTKVTYPDGKIREFNYDDKGQLTSLKEPSGIVWTKDGYGWNSSEGNRFSGAMGVTEDGSYAFVDPERNIHVTSANGSKSQISLKPFDQLHAELKQEKDWQDAQSYMERSVQLMSDSLIGLNDKLQKAQSLDAAGVDAIRKLDVARIKEIAAEIPGTLKDEHEALVNQDHLNYYVSKGVILGSIFLPSKAVPATMAAWSFDAANPNDSYVRQAYQAFIGGLAGANISRAVNNPGDLETVSGVLKHAGKIAITGYIPFKVVRDNYYIHPVNELKLTPAER